MSALDDLRRRIPSVSLYAGGHRSSEELEASIANARRYRDAVLRLIDDVEAGEPWPPRETLPVHEPERRRPTCGFWMPNAKEPCARKPGHGYEHRTRYAMENARRMSSGFGMSA